MKATAESSLGLRQFMARQPILDHRDQVHGYELLFRSSLDNFFHATGDEQASQHVVNEYLRLEPAPGRRPSVPTRSVSEMLAEGALYPGPFV